MIQDLGKRMEPKIEKIQEMFNKDLEEQKNKDEYSRRNQWWETEAEEWINDPEYRMVEITATEQNIEKRMKRNKDSLRDFWDNIKRTNIHIIGVPERGEREKGSEKISEEIRAENFLNMRKEIVNQVQGVQRVPCSINPRRNTRRHTETKLTKIKDRDKIVKGTREK